MVDTAVAEVVSEDLEQLKTLRNRKRMLQEAMGDLVSEDENAREVFEKAIANFDSQISEVEIKVRESVPEYKLITRLEEIAKEYVTTVTNAFEEANVEIKRWPIFNQNGTVSNAPRIPGMPNLMPSTRRSRTSTKGKVLDLSDLAESISHSFRGGETITATLDEDAKSEHDSTVYDGKISQLLDELYKTDSGDGFYTTISEAGATQSAFVIFSTKAGGRLMDSSDPEDDEDEDEESEEIQVQAPASTNGRGRKNK